MDASELDHEGSNEQNALDEDARMKYHLRFATTSRTFVTTCILQVVWGRLKIQYRFPHERKCTWRN
jgi:hypothetical protein